MMARRTGMGNAVTRYHRGVEFRCREAGVWRLTERAGTWQIERRRAEPGHPAGWYVVTEPGTAGERAGATWAAAADVAVDLYHAADAAWWALADQVEAALDAYEIAEGGVIPAGTGPGDLGHLFDALAGDCSRWKVTEVRRALTHVHPSELDDPGPLGEVLRAAARWAGA